MDEMIDEVIKQDKEAYLRALKATVIDYIILRIQRGVGSITEINPCGILTAKDIWDAMPETYKEQCVPVSFGLEYIVTKDFYNHLKEVVEN